MPLQKYVHQVKHGYFRPGLPQYEKDKIEEIRNIILSEMVTLPDEVFGGLPHEKNERQSSSKRDVIIVRSKDRDADRDEILRNLKQAGIQAQLGSAQSSVDPIDGVHDGKNFRIFVKPVSGGMAETTLNASITELFPCIAFELNHAPKSPQDFHQFLMGVNVSKLKCVGSKDVAAGQETINKADTSSKFEEKMNNAIGIHQFLMDSSKDKPIKNVFWGYRQKPSGVPKNHPGDMFIEYGDGKQLGVSLKAGGKKTSEPQLNTYVTPIFNAFGEKRKLDALMKTAYSQVYSKIQGMPPLNKFTKDRKTQKILRDFDKKNNAEYEKLYDQYLEIMRDGVVALFNSSKDKSLNYIKTEVLRDAPDVPTMVIKAIGTSYEEVTDKDAVGVFLPQVKFIKAYKSKSSKQNWFIELKSGTETLTMNMSIRTNKSGHAGQKKLGQFSLAVKYNGLAK
tara:strand:+ start:132 stop:1481 length:1350 start_codon:yes stop_codon:yes gene_type:complete